ncbi:MAG: MFS transporter [Pseudomonadales bacterium]|jgi:predicted MFS family arabinose efflux permease|nr:MFS transporter [Pseudomonadales bacterium]
MTESTLAGKMAGAFRYRDFRFLMASIVGGSVVTWMRILGTSQWILDETGSAFLVALIGVVQLVVQIPITLWAGTLADHVDRKRLLNISHGITAATLIGLGLANASGILSPFFVYVGIAVTAATHMMASPAASAMIPVIIPGKDLILANSTDTALRNVAAIVGPLLFAAIATTLGITTVFFTAGSIALLAALSPMLIQAAGKAEKPEDQRQQSQLELTLEGLRYTAKHPILPGLFLLDAGITTASFYREILPVLALGLFAGGASATGMLGAANSTGAILGSFIAVLLVGFRAKGMMVLYASFAYGFFLFGFGLANTLLIGIIMIALLGAADAVTVTVRQTTVMLTTPDHMRGRAFALLVLAAQTANNVGTIWVGTWAGLIGASNTMVMGGVISVIMTALIWWWWKPIREYRSE